MYPNTTNKQTQRKEKGILSNGIERLPNAFDKCRRAVVCKCTPGIVT